MGEVQNKNNRASARRFPKAKVRVTCHTDTLDSGPNLATAVLDISESGIRLLVASPLEVGQGVIIGLDAPMHDRPIQRLAKVIWSVPAKDGGYCVGVRLEKYLPWEDIRLV